MVACGTKRPVLYPNAALERAGEEAARRDVDECLRLAEQADVGDDASARVARDTAEGAAAGGAAGAAVGAVSKGTSVGRGAAAGAAGSGAFSFVRSLFASRDPDPIARAYVETCLRERGYRTIGWK
jgi:hypothetical protein